MKKNMRQFSVSFLKNRFIQSLSEIGNRPDWLTEATSANLYPVKDAVRKITAADLGRMKKLAAREFVDTYIEGVKQFYVKDIDKDTCLKILKR